MRLAILAFAAFVLAAAAPARAAEQVAALTPADQATVARVQESLNAIRTLKSHFVQVSSTGAVAEGELYLSRPGKLRINYAPPTKMQLVVQGGFLLQADLKLWTLTYIPLSRTPAAMLVEDELRLDGDKVTVTGVTHGEGLVRVGMVRPGREDEGSLTMVFSEGDLALKQWSVMDPQGVETRVTLTDPEVNGAIDPQVFDFDTSRFDSQFNQNRFN